MNFFIARFGEIWDKIDSTTFDLVDPKHIFKVQRTCIGRTFTPGCCADGSLCKDITTSPTTAFEAFYPFSTTYRVIQSNTRNQSLEIAKLEYHIEKYSHNQTSRSIALKNISVIIPYRGCGLGTFMHSWLIQDAIYLDIKRIKTFDKASQLAVFLGGLNYKLQIYNTNKRLILDLNCMDRYQLQKPIRE
jgi:hypothetical protein